MELELEPTSSQVPIDPKILQTSIHAAFGNRLLLAKAFDLPPPGVLVGIDEPFPDQIETELIQMGLIGGIPEQVPEAQRRESNRIFELIRQEPQEPRLGVGLDPWTGRLVGSLCSTDIVIIVRVCTATPPGVYRKFYDVYRVEGGTRERLTGLLLEIEIRGEGGPRPQPPQPEPDRVVLAVRAVNLDGLAVRAPIEWTVQDPAGTTLRQGLSETEFHLSVPQGGWVVLNALNTSSLTFRQWQGAPPGANPVRAGPVNSDSVVTAVYEEGATIPTEDKVTLTVRAWKLSSTSPPQQLSGVPISAQPAACSGQTPYQCQVDKGKEVTLAAPAFITIGGIPHGFVQWWECPSDYPDPPASPPCTPKPPAFPQGQITFKADASKTMMAAYAPPE